MFLFRFVHCLSLRTGIALQHPIINQFRFPQMIRIALLLLFSSFLFNGNTDAQYEPMAIEGAHWVIFELSDNDPNHYAIVLKGDTVVNGIAYKKVYKHKLKSTATIPSELLPPYSYNETSLIGGIRDDATQQKVYAIAFTDESWHFPDCDKFQEQLLYDFSLIAGNTLNGCLHSVANYPPIVVDSLTTGFYWGKDRNILTTEMGAVLEGFGTASGPFTSLYDIPAPGNPFQPVDYCIGDDLECGFNFVDNTRDLVKENQCFVFPNPSSASQQIKIECPSNMDFPIQVIVFNPLGQIAKGFSIGQIHDTFFAIELDGFQPGYYTLFLKSQKKAFAQLLVIK